jgi:membrane-associated phospholipid phosphatase
MAGLRDERSDRAGGGPFARSLIIGPVSASFLFVVVFSAFFLVFPGVDLNVSALFYVPGRGFTLASDPFLVAFRDGTDYVVLAAVVLVVGSLAAKLARPERPSFVRPNVTAFLLWSLVLGPGLLVNGILKNFWGRPRPSAIAAFGGDAPYVEVWRITTFCTHNCSFVSGETSSAVWLVAVALVLPKRWRLPAILVGFLYAGLVSANRIAFGGHFASDVLLSFGLTLLVIALLHRLFIERPPDWLRNDALEARLTRLGRRLRGKARETSDVSPS